MAEHHVTAPPTSEQATRDLLALRRAGGGRALVTAVLGVFAVVGLIALVIMLASGPEPRVKWGFPVAVLAYLFGTAHAAPIIAFITRLAKGYWAIPIRRAAEIWGIVGVVTTPLFIVLILQLPEQHNRPSIWFNWPGAPVLWDSIFVATLGLTSLLLLWVSAIPDLAAARDAGDRGFASRWSMGWLGTERQWQMLTSGLVILGAFYTMVYVYVHLFVTADMAMSLVPGWKSSIFPAYHAISGFQAGLALTLITAAFLRQYFGLERYLGRDQFWGAAKILLATSLLFFYFTWSEHLLPWYGRLPHELFLLDLMFWGPYKELFIVSFFMNFVIPFALLIWNRIRVSIYGPVYVGMVILIGNFIDRCRIYIASWSVAGPVGQTFATAPPTYFPQPIEGLVVVGALCAVICLYFLVLRVLPPIGIWEYKTALMLKVERRYLASEVAVVAKPR